MRYPLLGRLARRLPLHRDGEAVVVFSPGHLGDILHVVPMLRALREGKPDAKIIWLVGPWSEGLARRYADAVDAIRVWGPNLPPYTRGRKEWKQSFWSQWRMAMALRREGIGTLIATADAAARFLANACCPRQWIGIGDWRPPRIRREVETVFYPYEKDRYEADAWAGVLKALGVEAHVDQLEYVVTPAEADAAAKFLRKEGVDSDRPLVLLAPGSGWPGKNWLPDRFVTLADRLTIEWGFQVAWVGGAGEAPNIPLSLSHQYNWAGQTSLTMAVALMEHATLFVGNDSGLLHFAAALNVPTVSIWGPTNPGKWGPKGPLHRQLRKRERCEGCIYWDYRWTCDRDRVCVKAVSVEDVLGQIVALLNLHG